MTDVKNVEPGQRTGALQRSIHLAEGKPLVAQRLRGYRAGTGDVR